MASESPEVQVEVRRLQNRRPGRAQANRAGTGPERGRRRVRSGQDVIDAELDLRLGFLAAVLEWAGPVRGQRAEGGVQLRSPCRRVSPNLSRVPEADLGVPAAAAAPEVSVLEEVEHRLAAGGEGPEVPLPLLVPLRPRNLGPRTHRSEPARFTHTGSDPQLLFLQQKSGRIRIFQVLVDPNRSENRFSDRFTFWLLVWMNLSRAVPEPTPVLEPEAESELGRIGSVP